MKNNFIWNLLDLRHFQCESAKKAPPLTRGVDGPVLPILPGCAPAPLAAREAGLVDGGRVVHRQLGAGQESHGVEVGLAKAVQVLVSGAAVEALGYNSCGGTCN